jgi:preprotein translocase SecE subunit
VSKDKSLKKLAKPFKSIGGYFKGAWTELKQVRWPTRRATWGLTLAVIIFTLFFVGFIVLFDSIFQRIFEIIIG